MSLPEIFAEKSIRSHVFKFLKGYSCTTALCTVLKYVVIIIHDHPRVFQDRFKIVANIFNFEYYVVVLLFLICNN